MKLWNIIKLTNSPDLIFFSLFFEYFDKSWNYLLIGFYTGTFSLLPDAPSAKFTVYWHYSVKRSKTPPPSKKKILSWVCCWWHSSSSSQAGWGYNIHWLHLCREGESPHPTNVLVLHKQSDGVMPGALGNAEYPFIAIALRSTLAWSGSTW